MFFITLKSEQNIDNKIFLWQAFKLAIWVNFSCSENVFISRQIQIESYHNYHMNKYNEKLLTNYFADIIWSFRFFWSWWPWFCSLEKISLISWMKAFKKVFIEDWIIIWVYNSWWFSQNEIEKSLELRNSWLAEHSFSRTFWFNDKCLMEFLKWT